MPCGRVSSVGVRAFMTWPGAARRVLFSLSFCLCALLLGCSEPEDSEQVAFCKVVVNYVAFNPSDMTYVAIVETKHSNEPRVKIEFDDYDERSAKDRRDVECLFGEMGLMTEIWLDRQPMIFEEVRNLNLMAMIYGMEKQIERIRASR
jgi:hypothetical protein